MESNTTNTTTTQADSASANVDNKDVPMTSDDDKRELTTTTTTTPDDEDVDEEDYEKSAKEVAEKVRRQQEGLESALLPEEHHDADYKTVDEIQALLDEQVKNTAKALKSGHKAGNMNKELASEIGNWYTERAKYIPVRLTMKERQMMRLIENVLKGCDYTDIVDGTIFKNKMKRIRTQINTVGAILTGIITALKYSAGQDLVDTNNFAKYERLFQQVFEIGRRYKVMNPEKLRGTYGKMVFMLQDAMSPEIRDVLDFEAVKPLKTVFDVFQSAGIEDALRSEWISTATMEILPAGKTRAQIQREIKAKEYALELIARKHANSKIGKEEIKQCLYSIGDNSSFLNSNCKPVDDMITYLQEYFHPDKIDQDSTWSLAIYGGSDGSRLTHSHERQYHYVLQSLTLWREIVHDMFRLWFLAEQDLLDRDIRYKLKDTGQGFHRLQSSPRTNKAMHSILYAVQQKLGHTTEGWVGSSVIHLGDTNVPNALVFIDKYNQVSRILNPIVQCLNQIDNFVAKDAGLNAYMQGAFGGAEGAKKTILVDFFKGAFDGSGADNFFEAGSCIDGRLTSAWNWCQSLSTKSYAPLFKLGGFLGFDGNFQS